MDYNGDIKTLDKSKIKFGYRQSNLSRFIILDALFKVTKKSKKKIKAEVKKLLIVRRRTQDYSLANAGCIFKNPVGQSAGKLIDLCSLKGKKVGAALVSKKHANFILNSGRAKAEDVLKLMRLIRKRVKDKFNINLEPEIKIW
jgi:UDP-N-acetylmuramate dehydrogenase